MGRRSSKHDDEQLAASLLRSVLGADVCRAETVKSRNSMYDLRLTYPDGGVAAAEVVSTRDKEALGLADAADRLGFVPDPGLRRRWRVSAADGASVRRIREEVPSLLLDLESQGLDQLPGGFGGLRVRARALFIRSCWSSEPREGQGGGFAVWPEPRGAFEGDANRVVREVERFLPSVPDVAQKLLASGIAERHAVVVATIHRYELLMSLEAGPLPGASPGLPEGIDHLWVVSLHGPPAKAVYWLRGSWGTAALSREQVAVELTDC